LRFQLRRVQLRFDEGVDEFPRGHGNEMVHGESRWVARRGVVLWRRLGAAATSRDLITADGKLRRTSGTWQHANVRI
jgi:hypothetical protein